MKSITPIRNLNTTIKAPPSKAHTLRAFFCASLADGPSTIDDPLMGEDQEIALAALSHLGIKIERQIGHVIISGRKGLLTPLTDTIYAGNSGVTARFLTALAGHATSDIIIDGDERMRTGRPLTILTDALSSLGVISEFLHSNGCPPVRMTGRTFKGGTTALRGDISSQYTSALLIAAPLAAQETRIIQEGEVISRPYIDITLEMLARFGIKVITGQDFRIPPGQTYRATDYTVEGDYSAAAFFLCAAAITQGTIQVTNLDSRSVQGDKRIISILDQMGCKTKTGRDHVQLSGAPLRAIDIDMGDCPDLAIPIAVTSAFAKGTTWIRNIGHLKYKECDRIAATIDGLKKMGISAQAFPGSMKIVGGNPKGAIIDSYNDHRIAMSFAIAGLQVPGISIEKHTAVKKSFPRFFDILSELSS